MSMSPCRPWHRIDVAKDVYYALDDSERNAILDKVTAENKRANPVVQRFKGLGEMNPCNCTRPPWCLKPADSCS